MLRRYTYEVIGSNRSNSKPGTTGYNLFPCGERRECVDSSAARTAAAEMKPQFDLLIVRPNFNEKDGRGDFFREWRAYKGHGYVEIRWYILGTVSERSECMADLPDALPDAAKQTELFS